MCPRRRVGCHRGEHEANVLAKSDFLLFQRVAGKVNSSSPGGGAVQPEMELGIAPAKGSGRARAVPVHVFEP